LIAELGAGVTGFQVGDRVLVGAITPCGQCHGCLSGHQAQCGHGSGYAAIGGWRFGNTINGAQAEYMRVPYAQANLAKIPDELSDEQVVLLPTSLRPASVAPNRVECASAMPLSFSRKGQSA
jgi:threonine dehydrogenase-like Zn-dependent dehydrogenase